VVLKAVRHQLERMPLSSQELLDPLRGALGELLGEIAPGDLQKCFFISNGTDAVEGAMKLARLFTRKPGFISCLRGFHGKSYGSLSLMGKAEYRVDFEPLLQDVFFVPYGDATAVAKELEKAEAVGMGIAGVVVEPIQGEAGAIVPPDDYWPRLREICDRFNVLLIADEVQTGLGRTGKLFGVNHWDVVPDIMCVGKALGGGVMPLSAFISTPRIWKVLETNPFLHSSTFGGNPLACAAGIAAIHVTLAEDLPGKAAKSGAYLI
jgi:putrescine aminotransferase